MRRSLIVRSLAVAVGTGAAAGPAAAQMLVGDGSISCAGTYVIASGDTLSEVSQRAYGDPMLYGILADENWDVLGGNPENVEVGMSIEIPCVDITGRILTPAETAEAQASLGAVVQAEGPLSAEELDTLFGPVALFPDPVLTPVLVASTFPLDVIKAGRFVEDSADLPSEERAAQAADQAWDDSVRELAAGFPDLVTRMSDNIDWTEQAGEAVVAQTDAVLDAIQRLRVKAQDNGYLVDNEAQTVTEVNDKVLIAPTNPGVVYVPTYDTEVVYTTPVVGTPVYHYGEDYDDDWGDALIAGGIFLGGAVILDEIFDDDDWDGWDVDDDIDWDGGDITIDRGDIDIDRGDINIDGGDRVNIDGGDRVNIGDGDRPQIGDGDRVSIGDSDRPQIDRDALADRAGDGRAIRDGSGRASISNTASRDVARQKIEARQSTGAAPARMRPSTGGPGAGTRRDAAGAADISRPPSASRTDKVSRPSGTRTPSARAPSRSSAFQQQTRRPSAASNRGRSSAGRSSAGRSGGGRSGGGGGRRR